MNKLFTFLFLCFFSSSLFAQEQLDLCFDFEELPLNQMFGRSTGSEPGDVLLEQDSVKLGLDTYTTINGGSEFFNVTILDNPFGLQGPDFSRGLFVSNINLALDFSDFSDEIVRVAFYFADGGGEENISVNGEPIQVVERFSELDREIAPGVELILRLDSTELAIESGLFVLEGAIKNLVIGGQELFIDNVCARKEDNAPCEISNIELNVIACSNDERSLSLVELDFDVKNTESEFYDILQGGSILTIYDPIPITDTPDTLVLPYLSVIPSLTISIFGDNDCIATINLEEPRCDSTGDCSIEIFDLFPTECNDIGEYLVNVFAVAQNSSPDGYFIEDINGTRWGPFEYFDSTVVIGPYSNLLTVVQEFTIIDANDETCQKTKELIAPCRNDCTITRLFLEAHPCDENGDFLVDIEVRAENGSADGFYIVDVFQDRFGPFSYDEPFVTLGPYFDLDDVPLVFTVIDAANEDCQKQEDLFDVCDRCRIEEVFYDQHPCDDNGQFLLDIEVVGGGSDSGYFIEFIGELFGPFSYGDSTITIGPLSTGFDVLPEIRVFDVEDQNCAWYDIIEPPCNSTCDIEIALEIIDCNENDQFFIEVIAFGGIDTYFIEAGGRRWGPFVYADSTARIGPFEANQEQFSVIVHDGVLPYCSDTLTVRNPCFRGDCGLVDIRVETQPCEDDGTADLLIDFDNLIVIEDTFAIKYEGRLIGYYNGENDLPLLLNDFPFGDQSTLQICTYDERGECATNVRVVLPDCGGGSCFLERAQVRSRGCDANGQFYFEIRVPSNIDHAGDGFVVDVSGEQFGPFSYQDSVVLVGPFDGNIDRPYEVYIFDLFRDDCFYIEEFASPCNASCDISDVRIAPKECDEDGQFYVQLSVWANNPSSETYIVDVFGERFGPFSYYDSTATIGPFDGNIDAPYEIIIYDSENMDCFYADIFNSPCDDTFCTIEDVSIFITECDNARQFFVELGAWNANPLSEGYRIKVNGEDYGIFSYYDSLAFIGPFDGNSNAPFEFIIQDLLDRNCIFVGEFFSPCSETCRLTDLTVETGECKDNGRFDIVVDFDAQSVTDSLFYLYYNDSLAGVFSVFDLPLALEDFGFAGSFDTRQHIKVCINDNPNCCTEVEFRPPCSISDCHITEVIAEPLICENNQFNVDLFVKSEQPNLTGYFLQINDGQIFGPFSYQQEFVTIGPFEGDGSTIYRITVIDGEDRSCRNGTRFQAVNCGSQCSISDLRIEVGEECNEDGTFPVTIDFDIQNPVGMGYSIYANDRLLGTYPYGTVPLYLARFDAFGNSSVTISIIAGEDRSCAMRKILETPECSLNNETVWPGDTDNNGIAHYTDLLNIGLAYGARGPVRPDTTIEWYAHEAPRWNQAFLDGTNYKHADTNGDGRIDELDVAAIELNYDNLRDGLETPPEIGIDDVVATEGDPSIYVDLPESGAFPNGSAFSVPVILGSADRSVESVYGIAFTIKYDPSVLDPSELRLTIPDSWLGDPEEDLLMIQREYPAEGLIEVAISRKDGEAVTGYGVVALMSGIIIDVIGFSAIEVGITRVKAVRLDSEQIPINPETRITKIITSTKKWEESGLQIYPNPVTDLLRLDNTSSQTIEKVEVMSLQGKLMKQFIRPENEILLSDLPSGLYFLKVQLGEDFYHQQIVKQ